MIKSTHQDQVFNSLIDSEILKDSSETVTNDSLNMIIDAVNSSINGMIVTDLKGIIKYCNPSFCRIFDYAQPEVFGKNAAELFATKEVRSFSDVVAMVTISSDHTQEFIVEKKNGKMKRSN